MGETVSEHVSEKPKRGRPPLLDQASERAYRGIWGQSVSTRTVQNRRYVNIALAALEASADVDRYAYLFFVPGPDDNRPERVRMVILSELGRMHDADAMRFVADHICEQQLSTRQAVVLIRRVRLGEVVPKPERLEDAILATVNRFAERYPQTPPASLWRHLRQSPTSFKTPHTETEQSEPTRPSPR